MTWPIVHLGKLNVSYFLIGLSLRKRKRSVCQELKLASL